MKHCQHCGHWHGETKCQAITHNETGGAHKCCRTGTAKRAWKLPVR